MLKLPGSLLPLSISGVIPKETQEALEFIMFGCVHEDFTQPKLLFIAYNDEPNSHPATGMFHIADLHH